MSKRNKQKESPVAEPLASTDVLAYMCAVDFSVEIAASSGGTSIYFTADDCRKHRGCVKNCGMVEVRLKFLRFIETPTDDDCGRLGESHRTCFITKQDYDSNLGKAGEGIIGYAGADECVEHGQPGGPAVEVELRLRGTVLSGRF